jgi:hypothetical protein
MKQFLKKVVGFSISFLLGIFVSSFYNSSKISTNSGRNSNYEIQSTFFNPPEPMKCGSPETLERLIEKREAISNWIMRNPNAPKKQKEAKLDELVELNRRILDKEWQEREKQIPGDNGVASDLLYKCNESKWKNLKPGN